MFNAALVILYAGTGIGLNTDDKPKEPIEVDLDIALWIILFRYAIVSYMLTTSFLCPRLRRGKKALVTR